MARMKTSRRSKAQTARDTRRVSELYLQGKLQSDIASLIGISQATVSRTLEKLRALWLEQSVANRGAMVALELAKVDNLELQYWQAWQASQEPKRETTTRSISLPPKKGKKGKELPPKIDFTIERGEKVIERDGSHAFLDGIQWCIERRCELLGLDAPKRADLTTGGKEIIPGAAVIYLPDNNRSTPAGDFESEPPDLETMDEETNNNEVTQE